MKPTAELSHEHQAILRMITILDHIADRLDTGAAVDPDDLDRAVDFIRAFADKCHHGKEEGHLFPEMEKAGIPREHGPIGVMLAEHAEGRRLTGEMAAAVPVWRRGDGAGRLGFVQAARSYIALLTQHIHKEDHVLFPMADARLSPEQQRRVAAGFAEVERTVIGEGGHEELERLLVRMAATYGA